MKETPKCLEMIFLPKLELISKSSWALHWPSLAKCMALSVSLYELTIVGNLTHLQAERTQKKGGMVMCATVLVIMCFIMLVLLILKAMVLWSATQSVHTGIFSESFRDTSLVFVEETCDRVTMHFYLHQHWWQVETGIASCLQTVYTVGFWDGFASLLWTGSSMCKDWCLFTHPFLYVTWQRKSACVRISIHHTAVCNITIHCYHSKCFELPTKLSCLCNYCFVLLKYKPVFFAGSEAKPNIVVFC